MSGKTKHIPTVDELVDWLKSASKKRFPNHPNWCVSAGNYHTHSPDGWCQYRTLLSYYGYIPTSDGWASMVRDYVGMHVPQRSEYQRPYPINGRASPELDMPIPESIRYHPSVSLETEQAIKATRYPKGQYRMAPIKLWNWRTHAYEIVDAELVIVMR